MSKQPLQYYHTKGERICQSTERGFQILARIITRRVLGDLKQEVNNKDIKHKDIRNGKGDESNQDV
jgi:hypothetical protein